MPITPVSDRLTHNLDEVEENGRAFDLIASIVPCPGKYIKALVAAEWVENLRQSLVGPTSVRLASNLLPENIDWTLPVFPKKVRIRIVKNFTDAIKVRLARESNGLCLPFGITLRRDVDGYYILR